MFPMLPISLRLAWRGLRQQPREHLFLLLCLFLGTALLVGVGATSTHLRALVGSRATGLLAADFRIEASHALDDFLKQAGMVPANQAASLEFTAMVQGREEVTPILAEVKAVTPRYPLRGTVTLASGGSLADQLADHGAVVETTLLTRLQLRVGDTVTVGAARLVIRDVILQEPDRVMTLFSLGPRLFIGLEQAEATGLVQHGSRVKHVMSFNLDQETPAALIRRWKEGADRHGVQLLTPGEGQPMVRRFVERLHHFLNLSGLLIFLLIGVGLAGAMAAHAEANRPAVAVLKCLGADNATLFALFAWQFLLAGGSGALLGALAGALLPPMLLALLGELFPGAPAYQPQWQQITLAATFCLGLAGLFALGPVWAVRRVSPNLLFRTLTWRPVLGSPHAWPLLVLGLALACLGVVGEGEARVGGYFLVGSLISLGVITLLGRAGLALAQRLPLTATPWRLARNALARETTPGILTALGLGLAALFALVLMERNLQEQLAGPLAQKAPDFFFIDLQADQRDDFARLARERAGPEGVVRVVPVIRGRLAALRGKTVTPESIAAAGGEGWRYTREYISTVSSTVPEHNSVVTGRWWGENEAGISLEQGMARALGLAVGDSVAFDIQGVVVTGTVMNLRHVAWRDMGLNFFVVFSPVLLEGAPLTHLASISLPREQGEALVATVTRQWSNVTAIPTRVVMETVQGVVGHLARVVRLVGLAGVIAGLLILVIHIHASRHRRAREGALWRLLGATRGEVSAIVLREFLLLGLLAALPALVVGQGAAAVMVKVLMDDLWQPYPGVTVLLGVAGVGVVAGVGWAGVRWEKRLPVVLRGRG